MPLQTQIDTHIAFSIIQNKKNMYRTHIHILMCGSGHLQNQFNIILSDNESNYKFVLKRKQNSIGIIIIPICFQHDGIPPSH